MNEPPQLDHAGIAARLPHAGAMCLLQAVHAWGADHLHASASNQADPQHPLRLNGELPAASAIEYAAQATALHAALMAEQAAAQAAATGSAPPPAPRPGFLASARRVALQVARLDDVPGALQVQVRCLAAAAHQASYEFTLRSAAGQPLAEGRVSVVLDSLPTPTTVPTP